MSRYLFLALTITLLFAFGSATADSNKELREQQKAAQKEPQAQKKERSEKIKAAHKQFKAYSKTLKKEYKEQVADSKLDFDLKLADLKAEHEVSVAEAAAENQKKTMSLFMKPNVKFDQSTLENLQKEAKIYSDELFVLKKQSAEKMQMEQVNFEKRKAQFFSETVLLFWPGRLT